jgi:hypothetical protein
VEDQYGAAKKHNEYAKPAISCLQVFQRLASTPKNAEAGRRVRCAVQYLKGLDIGRLEAWRENIRIFQGIAAEERNWSG